MISRRSFIAGLALGLAAAPLTTGALRYHEVEKAARLLHVAVQALGVHEPNDFDAVFRR